MNRVNYVLRVFVSALFLSAVSMTGASAAADMFLKIEGIDGESVDKAHKGWIDIESFSLSSRAGDGAAAKGPGQVLIRKQIDKSSPKIQRACKSGKAIRSAVISSKKTKYKMSGVKLSGCSGGSDGRVETFSLNYQKIQSSRGKADAIRSDR